MRETQVDIAVLTHHLDELTAAVKRFRRDCSTMIDPDCQCLLCDDLRDSVLFAGDMLNSLREALSDTIDNDADEEDTE